MLNEGREKLEEIMDVLHAIGKQLKFIARDIRIIEQLASLTPLTVLNKQQYKNLLVVQELYRQQLEMYTKQTHQIDDRIVSIHQPHVRPIVRGKAKAKVEFGSTVSMSMVNGYAIIEDATKRNAIEGKFGEGKRKYGLNRIRARLAQTSFTVVALQTILKETVPDEIISLDPVY
ncbi:hypothetical protein skT53_31280 [Effusibacillus dendaii]|uniref:Transposase DDE domain-containing protein n=1 Tax=Effusibacillus dendaii TaxID=2743772 RepID=A0A7I8DD51_9BACL|nr:hypothetical protein skT53_31280 [Effusibacillus dendaii]